jgi:hypothetical protein
VLPLAESVSSPTASIPDEPLLRISAEKPRPRRAGVYVGALIAAIIGAVIASFVLREKDPALEHELQPTQLEAKEAEPNIEAPLVVKPVEREEREEREEPRGRDEPPRADPQQKKKKTKTSPQNTKEEPPVPDIRLSR